MRFWYDGFLHRHPNITERWSTTQKKIRIDAEKNTAVIQHYYNLLSEYKDLPPQQKYAGDESGFDGDTSRCRKSVVPTGAPRPQQRGQSYTSHSAIMLIGNAAGDTIPGMIMLSGKLFDPSYALQAPSNWMIGFQENGYFMAQHFLDVLSHLVNNAVKERPLLFIVDGAKAHVDVKALNYAIENKIHILCLPPNTTHFLQVHDVSVFGPLKQRWNMGCMELKM